MKFHMMKIFQKLARVICIQPFFGRWNIHWSKAKHVDMLMSMWCDVNVMTVWNFDRFWLLACIFDCTWVVTCVILFYTVYTPSFLNCKLIMMITHTHIHICIEHRWKSKIWGVMWKSIKRYYAITCPPIILTSSKVKSQCKTWGVVEVQLNAVISALDGREWSHSRPGRFNLGTQWRDGWVDCRAGVIALSRDKSCAPVFNRNTTLRPSCPQPIHYTDYAIYSNSSPDPITLCNRYRSLSQG
jgi:hypothetical protein